MKSTKKILSIILSVIISLSAVFAIGSSETFVDNLSVNAITSGNVSDFKSFVAKKEKNLTMNDVVVDLYEKLSDGNTLVIYSLKDRAYTSVLHMCCIDKYYYEFGSMDEARIFDGKKLISIKEAFDKGKISKKVLAEIDGYLKDMKVNTMSVKAGEEFTPIFLLSDNKSVKSSNKKVVKILNNKEKTPVALKKGMATITATDKKGIKVKCKVKVTSNPELSKNNIIVKKGQTVNVKIKGKASGVNNKYKNTKYAKVISKKSAKTIKIKGLKKGNTTLKITVNGKKLNLKVNIK